MEEVEAPPVAQRQCVGDLKIQGGELAREVGPAPGDPGGAKRAAGVKTAQDVQEQVVGEVTKAVLMARNAPPPPGADRSFLAIAREKLI